MEDVLVPIMVVGMLFIGLPWLIFHYVTRWKTAATLTTDDERLLDDLHETARRLDDRLATIERILPPDHPVWLPIPPVSHSASVLARRERPDHQPPTHTPHKT